MSKIPSRGTAPAHDKRSLFKTNLSRRALERAKGGQDGNRQRHEEEQHGARGVSAGASGSDAFGAGFGDQGSSNSYAGPGFSTATGGGSYDEIAGSGGHRGHPSMNDAIMSASASVSATMPEAEDPRKVDYSSMRSGPEPESRLERHEMAAPVLRAAPDVSNEPTALNEFVRPSLDVPSARNNEPQRGGTALAATIAPTFDLSGEGMSLDEAMSGSSRRPAVAPVSRTSNEVDLSQFGSLDEALAADAPPRQRR